MYATVCGGAKWCIDLLIVLYHVLTTTPAATAQGKEKQDFMNEIEMMKRITSGNPHIVNMIGCVTRSEPVCLMCELVTYGSLLSYLRTHQKKVGRRGVA